MKKAILVLLVGILVLSGLEAAAINDENKDTIIKTVEDFFISDPIITQNNNYISLEFKESTSFLMNPYEPVIPKVTKVYVLPVGSDIIDVLVTFSNPTNQKLDYKIRPAPEPIIEGFEEENPIFMSEVVYSSDQLYPNDSFYYRIASGRYEGEHVMFLIVHYYPIRYLPSEDMLISYSDIEIEFSYNKPTTPPNTITEGYDLLIIAPKAFENIIQPLIDFKNDNGMSTKLTTVEDIYADYTQGRDDQENIKLFIKDEFDENGITYVLLFGGQIGQLKKWYIPVRNTNNHAGANYEYGVDSDLYYADLYKESGTVFEDWDSNGNDIFAEFTASSKDIIDGVPDVFVGRLACRSKREAKTLVNKIINYEDGKADDSWFKHMVLVGGDTYWNSGDPLGYEAEIDTNVSASYMTGFNFERLWASTGALTGMEVVEEAINNGAGFIHMAGHANPASLSTHPPQNHTWISILRMWNLYSPLHINPRLNNKDMLPVIVIGGCHNSQFNVTLRNIPLGVRHEGLEYFNYTFYRNEWVPKCFSWWLVSRSNGGAIAAMGNSGLGMGIPGFDYPNGLDGWLLPRFFYNYGQMGLENLGAAHSAAVTDYALEFDINTDNSDRQMIEQWPLLGDPSLMLGGYE